MPLACHDRPSERVRYVPLLLAAALAGGCKPQSVRPQYCGTALWARQEYQRSGERCAGGDLQACVSEAESISQGGYFVPTDKERARQLYARACSGGITQACGHVDGVLPSASPLLPKAVLASDLQTPSAGQEPTASGQFASEPGDPSSRPSPLAESHQGPFPMNDSASSEIELRIDRVVPITQYRGEALRAAVDPRFILVGQLLWVQRQEVLAVHSKQGFAIHSPTQLGLSGWQRGDTICLLLSRTHTNGQTLWRLSATKPDAGCRGGG